MYLLATLVYFQLKYCERCGGLWLRPDGGRQPLLPQLRALHGRVAVATRRPPASPCQRGCCAASTHVAGVYRMTHRAAPLPLPPPELSVYRDHCVACCAVTSACRSKSDVFPPSSAANVHHPQRDYHAHSFEDTVVFVIDVERCLDRLHPFDKELIALIVLQEYTQEEAARIVHLTERQVRNRLCDAIDAVSAMFLEKRMLKPKRRRRRDPEPAARASQTFTIACCADPQVSAGMLAHSENVSAMEVPS